MDDLSRVKEINGALSAAYGRLVLVNEDFLASNDQVRIKDFFQARFKSLLRVFGVLLALGDHELERKEHS